MKRRGKDSTRKRWSYFIMGSIIAIAIVVMIIWMNTGGDEPMSAEIDVNETENILMAGGCFWCMESHFEKLPGVVEVISGYAGGTGENPTYEDYAKKGHLEVVKVIYDPKQISYPGLLEHFFTFIDPLDSGGQFCDRGSGYRSALFYNNTQQKAIIEESMQKVSQQLGTEVQTKILERGQFYRAEEYHQHYYEKNPIQYGSYKKTCGREKRVNEIWEGKELSLIDDRFAGYEKPRDEVLKRRLTDIEYEVTQKEGTEQPFQNEYLNNTKPGIYVDILSGEPLFSSTAQFKSGTGWPSFTMPIDERFSVEKKDRGLFSSRTEIRSRYGDNHIGHVFADGPSKEKHPQGTGLRYCLNSAALKFIPKSEMKEKGYADYLYLFG